MKHLLFACMLVPLCMTLCNCAQEPIASEPASDDSYFPIGLGNKTLQLQLAVSDAERALGLMFRDELETDHGMLFIFEEPAPQGFWMRNTQIPLDLGYFDASGKLLEIHKLYPYDENTVKSYSQEVLIVIETNRGWYADNHILPGARIDLDALSTAIRARGLSLQRFPIQPAH